MSRQRWVAMVACIVQFGVSGAFAAELAQTAQHPQWRKLLHYHRFFPFTPVRGEVDGDGFYISPEGQDDPEAELKATLDALRENRPVGKLKQPVRCAFPERHRWLQEHGLALDAPRAKKGDCALYDDFIDHLRPQSVSLVFSSAYASNPGSMFGHTLLKIGTGRNSDLLDRSVSFAATVPEGESGAGYVVLGLMGGYAGQYSFKPYYEKVGEYINAESRDLWEYPLNLTPEESRRLVDHFWELESNSWFDYYFINKNCSYQLLTVIEVVKPDWDISSGWVFVVPAETVKRVLEVPNSVRGVRYRPSLRRKLIQAMNEMSEADLAVFSQLVNRQIEPKDVQSAGPLDATIHYIQFARAESEGEIREDLKPLWQQVLARRSAFPPANTQSAYQDPPRWHPESGHGPLRIGLSHGWDLRGGEAVGYGEFHIKPAYHDLLNDDRGYMPFSEINFPNLTFRYSPERRQFRLEQLQFMGMTSLVPRSLLEKRLSWKVDLSILTPEDFPRCESCHVFHGEMNWGVATRPVEGDLLLYALAGAYFELGEVESSFGRVGPSADVGFLANPWSPHKIRLRGILRVDPFSGERQPLSASVDLSQSFSLLPHWELRLIGSRVQTFGTGARLSAIQNEAKLSLNYYF